MSAPQGQLRRLRNTCNDKHAHVLFFRMDRADLLGDPRYMGIIQEDSWSNADKPKKLRVGMIGGFESTAFARGTPVPDFPHALVVPDNIPGVSA